MDVFGTNNPGFDLSQFTDAELIILEGIAGLADPNADRILFWDNSAGEYAYLSLGTGLSITGTTLNASVAALDGSGTTNQITYWVDSDTIGALTTATYPSLTELSYIKGVTSAVQTQLDAKQASDTQLTALAGLSYSGNALKVIRVNAGENGFEFAAVGTGDVTKVGTPANNQIGVWTGDGTIEGDASLTWDGTSLNIATAKNFQIAGTTILADAAGTTTLSGIDAIDATTEATIEAAIDTLANLTSIQGRTVTLADAGANAVFGWDDTAGAYENLTQAEVLAIIGDSTSTAKGVVELATDAETVTGTDTVRATTPANIAAKMAAPGTIGGTTPGAATFTTVTVNTGITLSENASIALDPAGSADGKYSGITVTGTGGATIAFGDLVTLDKDDSRWELVDISVGAAATGDARGIIGIAVTSSTDGGAITVLLHGTIRADSNFPTLTIGAPVYASTTGDIVVAQPTTTDYVIRIVGFAITADEIYFNPSNDYTTHV